MASSKMPIDFFDPPQSLLELSGLYEVHCNIRPNHRKELKEIVEKGDKNEILMKIQIPAALDYFWSEPIHPYLKSIRKKTLVAMLIQGPNPKDLYTLVVCLESVYWASDVLDNYPRLDFTRPESLAKKIEWNVWGAFVIAIAPVRENTKIFGQIVSDEDLFMKVIKESGFSKKTEEIRQTGVLGKIP